MVTYSSSAENFEKNLKKHISEATKIFVLTDEHTSKYCLPFLTSNGLSINEFHHIEIKSGEEEKTLDTAQFIWQKLTDFKADRKSLLINLGGGVITDIGGFCAATYKRGMKFIQIPTTLLGMVDAAIGGKTGVDFGHFKNHVGVFALPNLVIVHPHFLQTLPEDQIRSGYAECVKHALIESPELWAKIKTIKQPTPENITPILWELCQVKINIVERDPTEQNERKKLNYGHTLGHAWESYLLENKITTTHGDCVAMGMIAENLLAKEIGLLNDKDNEEANQYIQSIFPLPKVPTEAFEKVLQNLLQDKKNEGGEIRYTLLGAIGDMQINQTQGKDVSQKALEDYNNQYAV